MEIIMVCYSNKNINIPAGTKLTVFRIQKIKGPFRCVLYAWGNVDYTLQCAFHITLNIHSNPCLHCIIGRCYSNRQIHLALLDN